MPVPLAAIAIGAGVVRAGAGIFSAGKNARKSRDLIKRAYQVAKRKQERDQGYTRQGVNESLNARGIMNAGGGSGMPASGPIATAYGGGFDAKRMAVSSTSGQQGQGNTLSGGVNTDLSKEFFDEQQDLWMKREAGINATKQQQSSDTIGAIGAGFDMGMNVYGAGKALGYGAKKPPVLAPAPSPPSSTSIRGAFGIDPVDPLGLSKQSMSGFAFNTGSK